MTFDMPRSPESFGQSFQPLHETPADMPAGSVFDGPQMPGHEPPVTHLDMTAPPDRGQPRMSASGNEGEGIEGSGGEGGPPAAHSDRLPTFIGGGESTADQVAIPGQTEPVTNDVELPDDVLTDRLKTDAGAADRTAPPNGLDTAGYDADAIGAVMDDQLVEADLTPGITAKYTLRDNPDIILRQDRGVPRRDLEQTKEAADALQGYGVSVLPSDVIDHGGTPYVATVRVNGVTLEQALASNPSDELIGQVEKTWKGLVDALIDCRLHNRPTPNDVSGPWQYMVGTTPGDNVSRVRLVDLPYSAPRANEGDTYEYDLTYLAGDIIRVEQLTGREMEGAREVMEHALMLCRDTARFGDGLKQAIAHMLDNSEIITPDEDGPNNDLIQRLRTK